jgi:DNA uptake protein ComE-like DNA-binding protein
MARIQEYIKTQPYVLFLNQIEMEGNSGIQKSILNKASKALKKRGINSVLPIVCLTDSEDKYRLLMGSPIYEAAKLAGLKDIWVFLIAAQQAEASQWLEQTLLLSKLNETAISSQDTTDFIKFINNKDSDLTSVKGIGPKTAQKIIKNRSYNSLKDLQKQFGSERPLNWIRAFKKDNENFVSSQDKTDFINFINDKGSNLTSIKGIGPKTAQKIIESRTYESLEDLKNQFGQKLPLNWIRAFKQKML